MTNAAIPITRRTLLGSSIAAMAASYLPLNAQENTMAATEPFWPHNARLAVSFSLMFEAGGQPISGAGGVIPDPIEKGLPDLPTNGFFQYGVYEGVPRILDLMDKHQVNLSSFMIGQAVEKAPDLAREIVKRGHEAAAHGRTWQNSYFLDPDAERKFIADCVETIQKVTGQQPIGWNAYWMRNSRTRSTSCSRSASSTTSTNRAWTSRSSSSSRVATSSPSPTRSI